MEYNSSEIYERTFKLYHTQIPKQMMFALVIITISIRILHNDDPEMLLADF